MKLLDLFCGAGGAGMGYHQAGFEVIGVDIALQKHYPFGFHQADAFEYLAEHWQEFDVIHASPPCQAYSVTGTMPNVKTDNYPKLIKPLRIALQATGKPYVIENVVGAPLYNPVILCGIMFDLRVYRHRLFETNPYLLAPGHKTHPSGSVTKSYRAYSAFDHGATHISMAGHNFRRADAVAALNGECAWMTREELAEAIPPAYTKWIGEQLLSILQETT